MDDMNTATADGIDVRIFGDVDGLRGGSPQVSEWRPPLVENLSSLPPLPESPPRLAHTEMGAPAPTADEPPSGTVPVRQAPAWIVADSVFEAVWRQPEEAAHLLRSMALEDGQDGRADFHRAALVLVSLGVQVTAEIIGPDTFPYGELCELSQAISDTPQVSVEAQKEHLATFGQQLEAREWIRTGGVDFAYQTVRRARGMRMARHVTEPMADLSRPRFTILNKVPAAQIAPGIVSEHPQTIALLLSQLEPTQAGAILAELPERLQSDVAYRIASIDEATPAAIRILESNLEESFRDAVAGRSEIGGTQVTAKILKASTSEVERNVLRAMDAQAAEMAAVLRKLGCRREEEPRADEDNGDPAS